MEELVHQQLLRLNEEGADLDARIEAVVGKMEAARAEADKKLYKEIYDNLVAREKVLDARRAALEVQLAGKASPWNCPLLHAVTLTACTPACHTLRL